ncbi:MAG: PadR family transcriptional regulator [Acidobacteriota bacterium]|nr:PadR family transcriptional regulator [Acidobacteriota bacterium]
MALKDFENKEKITKLTDKEFLIIGLLIPRGEMFGLELVDTSDGELKRGTVYVTLQRMVERGFIESREEDRVAPEVGIPRRMYQATGLGERIYRAQSAAAEQFNLIWGSV